MSQDPTLADVLHGIPPALEKIADMVGGAASEIEQVQNALNRIADALEKEKR